MSRSAENITQAELKKGAELMAGQSSAAHLICTLYMNALARRVADGAAVQPGPLAFDPLMKTVWMRKPAASDSLPSKAMKNGTA